MNMNIADVQILFERIMRLGELNGGQTVKAVFGVDDAIYIGVMLILMVVSTTLSILLAPKPPSAKAATLEDFSAPTAEQDRPIPVIFGTVWITGPNVVWYGDLRTEGIPAPGGKK
jgi:hypothetical protein